MIHLRHLISLNALLFTGFGIGFALYAPLMLAGFGTADIQGGDSLLYWYVVSFARLFGAALFGWGFLLWAIRDVLSEDKDGEMTRLHDMRRSPDLRRSPDFRRSVLLALILADIGGLLVALTQQASIWVTPTGWFLAGIFLLFLIGYGYFLSRSPVKGPESPQI
jgi:hypothetical protein